MFWSSRFYCALCVKPATLCLLQGWEQQFAVNHLGHFLLTTLLRPELQASTQPSIVVNVSSIGHWFAAGGIDYAALQRAAAYDPVQAYADSKLANVMFSQHLAQVVGQRAFAVHPGIVDTGLWSHAAAAGSVQASFVRWLRAQVMKTPAEGAAAILACVVASTCGHGHCVAVSGGFHADGKPCAALPIASDASAIRELMSISTQSIQQWWTACEQFAVPPAWYSAMRARWNRAN